MNPAKRANGGEAMSDEEFDPLVQQRAAIDQALAEAPELARAIRGVFMVFKAEGFSNSEALYLTALQFKESPLSPP